MPVSRGRKRPSKKPDQPRSQSHKPPPQKSLKTLWEKIRDHPIPWIIGLTAAVLAIGEPMRQALLSPDISIDPVVDSTHPFAFPFIVRNESWLFAMRRTDLNCGVDEVQWRAGGGMKSITIKDSKRAMIMPGESALFRCSIDLKADRGSGFELTKGHLLISVNYYTLWWIPRRSSDADFTWLTNGSSPHWMKGAPATFMP